MSFSVYLKKHTVYVPTSGRMPSGVHLEIEPVAVVAVADTGALRQALLDVIARGNPAVPSVEKGSKWPPPVLPKYARERSWSAFMRGTAIWSFVYHNGTYQIQAWRVHLPKGHATPDPEQKISLPPESTANDAVDRMIEILQSAASEDA